MNLGKLSILFRYMGLAPWSKDPQSKNFLSSSPKFSGVLALGSRISLESGANAVFSYTVWSFLSALNPTIEAVKH